MNDRVRILTTSGLSTFQQYIADLRGGSTALPPRHLLASVDFSDAFGDLLIENLTFEDRFAFGEYLVRLLSPLDRRSISRNHGLWSWLALYYFEQLCPRAPDGTRKLLAQEAYVLPTRYDFQGYYRHLVRTPWLAVADHGERARVLLIPATRRAGAALAVRGEIIEQLASRQAVIGNPQVIEAAYRMYFDEQEGRPRRGAGGSGGGSPRRLALILQQLDLTFDLMACPTDKVIGLLPKAFDRWPARMP
jgi:hypothetical protein